MYYMKFKRKQHILEALVPKRVLVIYGPRRVGKTTMLKDYIDTQSDKRVYFSTGDDIDLRKIIQSERLKEILDFARPFDVIAIDEAQWFGEGLVDVVASLLKKGKKVLVAGLALTYDREPFAPIPTLMTMADKVTKLSAICAICGDEAVYHKRITRAKNIDPHIADPAFVGKIENYQPRCRRCFAK